MVIINFVNILRVVELLKVLVCCFVKLFDINLKVDFIGDILIII